VAQRRTFGARWIVGTLLVAAIVAGCLAAGFWQLRRLEERRVLNDRIRERTAETVALPDATGQDPDDLIYRRVEVQGTYDPDGELLVRFRTRTGLPGYEVLTPLRTPRGTLLVDRGWVPLADGDRWPVEAMAPPAGEVEVSGLLAPPESGSTRLDRRPDGTGVVAAIDPPRLAEAAGADDVYPVYLLADDGGTPASSYPVPVPPPGLDDGPHRSYAVQWFLFASVGVVGWIVLLRRRGPLAPARPATRRTEEPADA
jgi:surfeit locus 1 family protein